MLQCSASWIIDANELYSTPILIEIIWFFSNGVILMLNSYCTIDLGEEIPSNFNAQFIEIIWFSITPVSFPRFQGSFVMLVY